MQRLSGSDADPLTMAQQGRNNQNGVIPMQTFVLKGRAGKWSYGYFAEPGKRNVWVYTDGETYWAPYGGNSLMHASSEATRLYRNSLES
jgi:hypothetical protein